MDANNIENEGLNLESKTAESVQEEDNAEPAENGPPEEQVLVDSVQNGEEAHQIEETKNGEIQEEIKVDTRNGEAPETNGESVHGEPGEIIDSPEVGESNAVEPGRASNDDDDEGPSAKRLRLVENGNNNNGEHVVDQEAAGLGNTEDADLSEQDRALFSNGFQEPRDSGSAGPSDNGNREVEPIVVRRRKKPMQFNYGTIQRLESKSLALSQNGDPSQPGNDHLDADYQFALALQAEEDRNARLEAQKNRYSPSPQSASQIRFAEPPVPAFDLPEKDRENCSKEDMDRAERLFQRCVNERAEEFVPTPMSMSGYPVEYYIKGYLEVLDGYPFPLPLDGLVVPPSSPKAATTTPLTVTTAYRVVSSNGNGECSSTPPPKKPLARVMNVTKLFEDHAPGEGSSSNGAPEKVEKSEDDISNNNTPGSTDMLEIVVPDASNELVVYPEEFAHSEDSVFRPPTLYNRTYEDEQEELRRVLEISKQEYIESQQAKCESSSDDAKFAWPDSPPRHSSPVAGYSNWYTTAPSKSSSKSGPSGSTSGSSESQGPSKSSDWNEGASTSSSAGPSNSNPWDEHSTFGPSRPQSGPSTSSNWNEGASTSSSSSNGQLTSSSRKGAASRPRKLPSTGWNEGASTSSSSNGPSTPRSSGSRKKSSSRWDEGASTSSRNRPSTSSGWNEGASTSSYNGPSTSSGWNEGASTSSYRSPSTSRSRSNGPSRSAGSSSSKGPTIAQRRRKPLAALVPEDDEEFTVETFYECDEPEVSSSVTTAAEKKLPKALWLDPENMPLPEEMDEEEVKKMPVEYIAAIREEYKYEENCDQYVATHVEQEYMQMVRSYITAPTIVPQTIWNTRFEVYARFPFLQRPLFVTNVLAALNFPDNGGDILPKMHRCIRVMSVPQFFKHAVNIWLGLRFTDQLTSRVISSDQICEAREASINYMRTVIDNTDPLFNTILRAMDENDIMEIDIVIMENYRDQIIEEKKNAVMRKLQNPQISKVIHSYSVTDAKAIKRQENENKHSFPICLPELDSLPGFEADLPWEEAAFTGFDDAGSSSIAKHPDDSYSPLSPDVTSSLPSSEKEVIIPQDRIIVSVNDVPVDSEEIVVAEVLAELSEGRAACLPNAYEPSSEQAAEQDAEHSVEPVAENANEALGESETAKVSEHSENPTEPSIEPAAEEIPKASDEPVVEQPTSGNIGEKLVPGVDGSMDSKPDDEPQDTVSAVKETGANETRESQSQLLEQPVLEPSARAESGAEEATESQLDNQPVLEPTAEANNIEREVMPTEELESPLEHQPVP